MVQIGHRALAHRLQITCGELQAQIDQLVLAVEVHTRLRQTLGELQQGIQAIARGGEPTVTLAEVRQGREAVAEPEVLLAEMQHRIKNNLQIVSSLLELQAARVSDRQAQDSLLTTQNRILALALIHEMLYSSEDVGRLNFADYARTLAEKLTHAYGDQGAIAVVLNLHPCWLALNYQMTALGLIFHELMTNALKHSLPLSQVAVGPPRSPRVTIQIDLEACSEQRCRLAVSHDGRPLPPDFRLPPSDTRPTCSMGLILVHRLVQRLGGQLTVQSAPGVTFAVTFTAVPG